jgi:methionyl-tRNA formyltransferase
MGAELLLETLPGYLSGAIQPRPQDERLASYAPMLKKEDGELDFNQPAQELERKVRAFQPWPGTFILWQDHPLKVLRASTAENSADESRLKPGQHVTQAGKPAICTSQGLLILEELQPAGKRPMDGRSFLLGARHWA